MSKTNLDKSNAQKPIFNKVQIFAGEYFVFAFVFTCAELLYLHLSLHC